MFCKNKKKIEQLNIENERLTKLNNAYRNIFKEQFEIFLQQEERIKRLQFLLDWLIEDDIDLSEKIICNGGK